MSLISSVCPDAGAKTRANGVIGDRAAAGRRRSCCLEPFCQVAGEVDKFVTEGTVVNPQLLALNLAFL